MKKRRRKITAKPTTTVVFCLPGRSFSKLFLESWSELLVWCGRNNINPLLSFAYDSNVYYVRSRCLGASVDRGITQKPFNSTIDYHYIMWIDSDMVFSPEHFEGLLNMKSDVACGIYKMADNKQYATVENWDIEYYKQNGSFEFLNEDNIKTKPRYISVDYSGMGWMLVKKGVIESIEYPWFAPVWQDFGNNIKEFTSEDVAFCRRVKEQGYDIIVDTSLVIGHEKSWVLK